MLPGAWPQRLRGLESKAEGDGLAHRIPEPARLCLASSEPSDLHSLSALVPGPPSGLETPPAAGAEVPSVGRPLRRHAHAVSPTLRTQSPSSIFCPAWPDASLSYLPAPLQAFAEPRLHHLPTSGSHATAGPPPLAGVEEGPSPVLRLSVPTS